MAGVHCVLYSAENGCLLGPFRIDQDHPFFDRDGLDFLLLRRVDLDYLVPARDDLVYAPGGRSRLVARTFGHAFQIGVRRSHFRRDTLGGEA